MLLRSCQLLEYSRLDFLGPVERRVYLKNKIEVRGRRRARTQNPCMYPREPTWLWCTSIDYRWERAMRSGL